MAKKAKRQEEKKSTGIWMLMRVSMVLIIIGCVISIVSMQNNIAEKKKEKVILKDNIEIMTIKNEELADLIESDDIGRYMEKLAVENNGYAYPDERRNYDTSRD